MGQSYHNILVGIDGSDQAKEALYKAIEVARRNQGKVIVATVIEPQISSTMGYAPLSDSLIVQEEQLAKERIQDAKDYAKSVDFGNIEGIVHFGSAKTALAKELPDQYQIDLVMVGQSGLNAIERLVTGSVSSYVIREASCDVLIVASKEVDEADEATVENSTQK